MYTFPSSTSRVRSFLFKFVAREINLEFRSFSSTRPLTASDSLDSVSSPSSPSSLLSVRHLRRARDIGINGLGRRYQLVSRHSSTSRSTWRSLHLFLFALCTSRAISSPGRLRRANISRKLFLSHFPNQSH